MNRWSQVISLEQNSSYTRVLIVTRDGRVRGAAFEAHALTGPRLGWAELDPAELWYKAKKVLAAGLDIHRTFPEEIAAVGITGEAATVIVWNRETGEPYCNAIAELDTRANDFVNRLRADGVEELVRLKTGLPLSARLSAARLAWLLDHVPTLRKDAESGRALFGGIDSWLLWRITGTNATDYTSAACTQLFNLETLDWDQELLDLFRIPRLMLPVLYPSAASRLYGESGERTPFQGAVPVSADLCAEQATLLGLGCIRPGDAAYLQTETLFLHTGPDRVPPVEDAWTSLAFSQQSGTSFYMQGVKAQPDTLTERLPLLAARAKIVPGSLTIDGDRASDDSWMQQQANALQIRLSRPHVIETAALGAAYAAGLAVGFWKDLAELRALWKAERVFEPRRNDQR